MALAVSCRSSGERPAQLPTGFGADWQVDLDGAAASAAVHGYAPDRLREAIGQPLLAALGLAHRRRTLAASPRHWMRARGRTTSRCDSPAKMAQERVHRCSIDPLPDGTLRLCRPRCDDRGPSDCERLEAETAAGSGGAGGGRTVARDRDRVLAALGHDVRTPMNSIMGICSLLLDSELEQEQRHLAGAHPGKLRGPAGDAERPAGDRQRRGRRRRTAGRRSGRDRSGAGGHGYAAAAGARQGAGAEDALR